jgi:O-acetyl-ADP-ribose deacetylase (regulator of RNase III)
LLSITHGGANLRLLLGDITEQDTDAIVNAANPSLLGGEGVDGAIHRAGGPGILEECLLIRQKKGECPTGKAVITSGGLLKARFVIHTVGPIWRGGKHNEDQLLADAYENSLDVAARNGITSIAFPSISTGAYRFPVERASTIALTTVRTCIGNSMKFAEVRFVVFTENDYETYSHHFLKAVNQKS